MAEHWPQLSPFGRPAPLSSTLGPFALAERMDLALAALSFRRGAEDAGAKAAAAARIPLPPPLRAEEGHPWGAFRLTADSWMVEAPIATHDDIRARLLDVFGPGALVTELTDGFVHLEVSGEGLPRLFERLCPFDLATAAPGAASPVVIHHIPCHLICRAADPVTLYGPRSMAGSLLHALETAALSLG